jgi:catechol 2,3-dioxygenase-like lactoylglutathione lyase family enzyme
MTDQMVPIFRVKDAPKATDFYQRIGFVLEDTHQFEPHLPIYAFLRRGDVQLHLSEHRGDAPKKSLAYFWVGDIDSIADALGTTVQQAPWARELEVIDPDGNIIRCGQPNSGTS